MVADGAVLKLRTSEGEIFEVEAKAASMSVVIKNMIDDTEDTKETPKPCIHLQKLPSEPAKLLEMFPDLHAAVYRDGSHVAPKIDMARINEFNNSYKCRGDTRTQPLQLDLHDPLPTHFDAMGRFARSAGSECATGGPEPAVDVVNAMRQWSVTDNRHIEEKAVFVAKPIGTADDCLRKRSKVTRQSICRP